MELQLAPLKCKTKTICYCFSVRPTVVRFKNMSDSVTKVEHLSWSCFVWVSIYNAIFCSNRFIQKGTHYLRNRCAAATFLVSTREVFSGRARGSSRQARCIEIGIGKKSIDPFTPINQRDLHEFCHSFLRKRFTLCF